MQLSRWLDASLGSVLGKGQVLGGSTRQNNFEAKCFRYSKVKELISWRDKGECDAAWCVCRLQTPVVQYSRSNQNQINWVGRCNVTHYTQETHVTQENPERGFYMRSIAAEETYSGKLSLSCQHREKENLFFFLLPQWILTSNGGHGRSHWVIAIWKSLSFFFFLQQLTGRGFWDTFNNAQSDGGILKLSIHVSGLVRPSREEAAGPVCWRDVERWSSMHYSEAWLLVSAYQVTAARRTGKYIR